MKKTFSLHRPDLDDARVLEAVRLELRKYVKRERRKALPDGFTLWTFACRVGATAESAVTRELEEVIPSVEIFAASGVPAVYVEILAAPGNRPPRTPSTEAGAASEAPAPDAASDGA